MPLKPPAWKKAEYHPVTEEDSSEDHIFENEKARLYWSGWNAPTKKSLLFLLLLPTSISIGTLIALLVTANMAHMASHLPATQHPSPPHPYELAPVSLSTPVVNVGRSCGHTYQEARTRGCIFDTISFAWLPPECYDGELVEEFDRLVHTPFFHDVAGTMEVPMDKVRLGEGPCYVPWAHHLWHCGFLWRKMHKAVMAKTPVDSYIGNYTHTEHCSAIMAGEVHGMLEVNTFMALKFPYCGVGELQWTAGTNYTGV